MSVFTNMQLELTAVIEEKNTDTVSSTDKLDPQTGPNLKSLGFNNAQNVTEVKVELGQNVTLTCSGEKTDTYWYMQINRELRGRISRTFKDRVSVRPPNKRSEGKNHNDHQIHLHVEQNKFLTYGSFVLNFLFVTGLFSALVFLKKQKKKDCSRQVTDPDSHLVNKPTDPVIVLGSSPSPSGPPHLLLLQSLFTTKFSFLLFLDPDGDTWTGPVHLNTESPHLYKSFCFALSFFQ
ncbi:hypothetical protein Q5P01_005908 [Channa striata]|uniref:Uncharacterized protein n=1 Tax=Channa striata TaxID=64152 RepID=A0AA88NDE4_CHASR|nr:hypothetical protein Q5P01_005908 [Channa striata]